MLSSSYKISFKYFTNTLKLHSFRIKIGKLLKRFAPYRKKHFFINLQVSEFQKEFIFQFVQ